MIQIGKQTDYCIDQIIWYRRRRNEMIVSKNLQNLFAAGIIAATDTKAGKLKMENGGVLKKISGLSNLK